MIPTLPLYNGRIKRTRLGFDPDVGLFTFDLWIEHTAGEQAFGGWCLSGGIVSPTGIAGPAVDREGRAGTVFGCEVIMRILQTLEVPRWEDLPGVLLRVDVRDDRIVEIGHIIKDRWFNPMSLVEAIARRDADRRAVPRMSPTDPIP